MNKYRIIDSTLLIAFIIVFISTFMIGSCEAPELDSRMESHSSTIIDSIYPIDEYVQDIEPLHLINSSNCTQPTYQEAYNFILQDPTDVGHEYILNEYDCSQYTQDTVNNATKHGIQAYYVCVEANGSGHAIVGFNTTDLDWVFFDTTQSSGNSSIIPSDAVVLIKDTGEMRGFYMHNTEYFEYTSINADLVRIVL
jgi:hypothetical protein